MGLRHRANATRKREVAGCDGPLAYSQCYAFEKSSHTLLYAGKITYTNQTNISVILQHVEICVLESQDREAHLITAVFAGQYSSDHDRAPEPPDSNYKSERTLNVSVMIIISEPPAPMCLSAKFLQAPLITPKVETYVVKPC
jgi:hypothetical protein